MRQLVHTIKIRVFEKDQANLDAINALIHELLPVDFEKENLVIEHEQTEGLTHTTIHILSLTLKKQRHTLLFLHNLFNHLSQNDKQCLYEQRESRMDDEGHFYLRLDKQQLLHHTYHLTDKGDCFHFTIKLAAFPAKRENFLATLVVLLGELGYPPPEN
jgi:RNA binding exosome subunit